MDNYDLVIAHRVYPGVSKNPFIKNVSKYDIFTYNLKSLKNSFGSLKVKIFFILDNCPKEFEKLINHFFFDIDYELIIYHEKQGNIKTFLKQIDILLNQDFSNLVYFSEDDYLYKKNSLEISVKIYQNKNNKLDFVTLYENPDYQNRDFHNYKKEVIKVNGLNLIKVSCTTLTFLTNKKVLKKTQKVFETFKYGNYDSSIFMSLSKLKIIPFQNLNSLFLKRDIIRFIKAWFFCGTQIIFGKKFSLFSLSPALATHMEEDVLAKNTDWSKIINEN